MFLVWLFQSATTCWRRPVRTIARSASDATKCVTASPIASITRTSGSVVSTLSHTQTHTVYFKVNLFLTGMMIQLQRSAFLTTSTASQSSCACPTTTCVTVRSTVREARTKSVTVSDILTSKAMFSYLIMWISSCRGVTVTCSDDEFRCNVHECIPTTLRCDGINHCAEGSDEYGCLHLATFNNSGVSKANISGIVVVASDISADVTPFCSTNWDMEKADLACKCVTIDCNSKYPMKNYLFVFRLDNLATRSRQRSLRLLLMTSFEATLLASSRSPWKLEYETSSKVWQITTSFRKTWKIFWSKTLLLRGCTEWRQQLLDRHSSRLLTATLRPTDAPSRARPLVVCRQRRPRSHPVLAVVGLHSHCELFSANKSLLLHVAYINAGHSYVCTWNCRVLSPALVSSSTSIGLERQLTVVPKMMNSC